jgi:hypothetical protein
MLARRVEPGEEKVIETEAATLSNNIGHAKALSLNKALHFESQMNSVLF